ncbi:MAG: GntR family transcriptional regulator [Firmicutes bacterium]|nr:GntR family transcriptional regulator [Bacillota bacterium]
MFDRSSSIPLHLQIKTRILEMVRQTPPEDRAKALFTETALAAHFGVNRLTVRQAVTELVREGVLYRVRGKGTFISPPKVEGQLQHIEHFLEEWREQQHDPQCEVLFYGWVAVPEPYAEWLQMTPGSKGLCFRRLRRLQGVPLALDVRYLPPFFGHLLQHEDIVEHPAIDAIVARTKLAIQRVEMHIEAVAAGVAEAAWLAVEEGAPLLRRSIIIAVGSGEPAIAGWSLYRGDRYRYRVVLPHA